MREPSTSITSLVKEVAREVFQEEMDKREKATASTDNCGQKWSEEEDRKLQEEFCTFINVIASVHGRGAQGIRQRIRRNCYQ